MEGFIKEVKVVSDDREVFDSSGISHTMAGRRSAIITIEVFDPSANDLVGLKDFARVYITPKNTKINPPAEIEKKQSDKPKTIKEGEVW